MSIEIALFLSHEGIALAHRQREGHWALVGEVALDAPSLSASLAELHAKAVERVGKQVDTLLILPDDQILYGSLDAPTNDPTLTHQSIESGLEGRTPYPVTELVYDWHSPSPDRVNIAVVASETLNEARGFAGQYGFMSKGFAALPPHERFPGIPTFDLEPTDLALLGLGEQGISFGPDTFEITEDTADHQDSVPRDPSNPSPLRPANDDAPLHVRFVDGRLEKIAKPSALGGEWAKRERLGRAALAQYLEDFDETQLTRIENALPRLGLAMKRLKSALVADDAFNPISVGMQGERVIRLSHGAPDRLMDDDGEDIAQFSRQVSLYLDRFQAWKAYKADATQDKVSIEAIEAALPEFQAVNVMLETSTWSAPSVDNAYGSALADVESSSEDALVAKALQDTTREVLYEVLQQAISEADEIKKAGLWSKYLSECKTTAMKSAAAATVITGLGLSTIVMEAVVGNATILSSLATRFPTAYPYLQEALKYLGLLV